MAAAESFFIAGTIPFAILGSAHIALTLRDLRHSNIGITQNIYIKSVSELQVSAMDSLSENLELCDDRATLGTQRVP
jgi:hypothetical protein